MSIHPSALLAALSADRAMSGVELARRLNITRAAIGEQIEHLRQLGAPIEAAAGNGYRLTWPIELLDAERIHAALDARTRKRAQALAVHWQIDSTNTQLQRRAAATTADVEICLAETQSAGRGRRGRVWQSPLGGNLYFSLLRRFGGGMAALSGLSLVAGIAVVDALGDCGVAEVGLKWPNDVLGNLCTSVASEGRLHEACAQEPECTDEYMRIPSTAGVQSAERSSLCRGSLGNGCKLAGILIELGGEFLGPCHAVIGIGIDLRLPAAARAHIDQPAIDVASLTGGEVPSRNLLAARLILRLLDALDRFEREGFAAFADAYARHDLLYGHKLRVLAAGTAREGIAAGVDERGALVVRHDNTLMHYDSAEVSVRAV
jgi:BirA family biotin operon repressor/biotin-[acetyl-CoA-carboxylase] ligase